uniref:S24 family peptidase n=1 Tax=Escherichia coli TaxID=562 RepID=UPI0037BF1200
NPGLAATVPVAPPLSRRGLRSRHPGKPQHGDIVIAEIDGEFTVKRLLLRPRPALEPVSDSPEFRTLYPENICIFGVVTHVIHRTRELR